MSLRDETGAERDDLEKSRGRFQGSSAKRSLPERWSLQRCVWFMEIFDPRTGGVGAIRQGGENFWKLAVVTPIDGAIAYGSASPLSDRCAATSPPFHGGEETPIAQVAALKGLGSSPPQSGGEVARRSRDGEGAGAVMCDWPAIAG